MFCPKCGTQNPETGKFCRSCGTDLGNVSQALTGVPPKPVQIFDRKGKPVSWDRAITKIFTGFAFLVVSIVLSFSTMGHGWWFWMLIPAFTSLGAGVAQYIQLKKLEQGTPAYSPIIPDQAMPPAQQNSSLPPSQTEYVSPDSRYKTGELVPPSVTEGTTRHLEMDSEGETMTLPKR